MRPNRNEPVVEERRHSGYIVSIGGRPPGWNAEYRTTDRALPPKRRTSIDYQRRLDQLERRNRVVDLMHLDLHRHEEAGAK